MEKKFKTSLFMIDGNKIESSIVSKYTGEIKAVLFYAHKKENEGSVVER